MIQMYLWSKERSYRGQAIDLFPEVGSTERHEDQSQEKGQGRNYWQEDGPDQKVGSRFGSFERCSDQKEKGHST